MESPPAACSAPTGYSRMVNTARMRLPVIYSIIAVACALIIFASFMHSPSLRPQLPSFPQEIVHYSHGIDSYCAHQQMFARSKVAQRPLFVYIGSSGLTQPGFVSFTYAELDITNPTHFRDLFCPNSVDIFFSEHTLEHIPLDKYQLLFSLFLQYLKPGGFVRTAIPSFSDQHVLSDVDKDYGHIGIVSAEQLAERIAKAGYVNVTILEQMHYSNGQKVGFSSKLWDECEGRVRRSMRFDYRNAEYLKSRYNAFTLVGINDIAEVINSSDYPRVVATIVQGHRPYQ